MKPGRTFLRRLIDLSTSVANLDTKIHVTDHAFEDIRWWREFIGDWNGREIIPTRTLDTAKMGLYTDASSLGMGGVLGSKWFMTSWPPQCLLKHINVLELFAVFTAIRIWGSDWRDLDVVIYTDNKPITQIWLTGSSQNKDIMVILRHIFFFLAKNNINVHLEHLYGYNNKLADCLSRLQVEEYRKITKNAGDMTLIPDHVWGLFPE